MVRLTFKEFLNEQIFAANNSPFGGDNSWMEPHEFKVKPSDPNDPKSVAAAKRAEEEQIAAFPLDPNNKISTTLTSKIDSGLQNLSPEEQAGIAGGKPVVSTQPDPRRTKPRDRFSYYVVPTELKSPSNTVDPKYMN